MGTSNCPDDAKDNVGAAGSNNSDDEGKGTEYDEAQTMTTTTTSTKTSTTYLATIDDRQANRHFEVNVENNLRLIKVSQAGSLYYHHCRYLVSCR